MKLVRGAWLPDDEADPVMLDGGARYQEHKVTAAVDRCVHRRTAIDVGAHCGLWTMQLLPYFERVEAFEPLVRHIECWFRNVGSMAAQLYPVALGERPGKTGIEIVEGLSGRSRVAGGGEYEVRTLDEFWFQNVDLVKIDVEGFELFIARGGDLTLRRWKPVVIVEQKPGHASRYGISDTAAVDYLKELGASVREEIAGDYIMTWEGAIG